MQKKFMRLGETIRRYAVLDSTNEEARRLAQEGAPEGTAIIAAQQTAGRGRQGRVWQSPASTGLYLSLILKPDVAPMRAALIPLAAAVAVAETLIADFQLAADIKYPNDVLVKGRKICGILVESAIEAERLQYAILGIGVNVAQQEFPDDLKAIATSMLLETAKTLTLEDVLTPLLAKLNVWYPCVWTAPEQIINRWQELSSYARDCPVRILSFDLTIEGTTRGLTTAGALLVELDSGEVREVVSGEVSLRKVRSA